MDVEKRRTRLEARAAPRKPGLGEVAASDAKLRPTPPRWEHAQGHYMVGRNVTWLRCSFSRACARQRRTHRANAGEVGIRMSVAKPAPPRSFRVDSRRTKNPACLLGENLGEPCQGVPTLHPETRNPWRGAKNQWARLPKPPSRSRIRSGSTELSPKSVTELSGRLPRGRCPRPGRQPSVPSSFRPGCSRSPGSAAHL